MLVHAVNKAFAKGVTAMSAIGWLFLLVILATVIGGLYMLRKTANKMPIGEEQMKLIKERQAELEAEERRREQ